MSEPVHRFFGYSIDESVNRIPNELDYDAVGLWQIIPVGRDDFGLSGLELEEFSKRHIIALLRRGAIPVCASVTTGKFWEPQLHYGSSPEEVADNILQEWKAAGVDPDVGGLWFALPSDIQ